MSTHDRLADMISRVAEVPVEQITPDTTLAGLDVDSLALVELGLRIKSDFGIALGEDEITADDTIADIARLVDDRSAPETATP
ncbi:acyl carrier protein (plasmid) [Streptomyces sp. BI20]|uniref:acyl carrier protein n=1 Tax=Streptomyces sp. BI20 TaxID=3403460 RepID=UPI003C709D1C